jgi:transposase
MEDNNRKRYTREYKLQVVRLVKDEQRKVSELSKDLGIESGLIYKWVRNYEKDPNIYLPQSEVRTSEKEEMRRLKKKLSDTYEENKILKKVLAIFSKQQNLNSK